ncbi:MAG: contact-dependent growth inhibition system immunity protein [Gemmatimonadales bacterium]
MNGFRSQAESDFSTNPVHPQIGPYPAMHVPPGASLYDLEGHDLPQAVATSMLDATLRRHRRTPVEHLGTEALRFLLEEDPSAVILLRVAIDRLERDPFLAGDFHLGDLLVAVLTRPPAIFHVERELRARAFLVARDAEELLEFLEPADQAIVVNAIRSFRESALPPSS